MRKFLEQALAPIGAAHEARWIEDFLHAQNNFNEVEAKKIIERRKSGEPLAYIFGQWAFREYEFACGKGVLIPRPETEELVDIVLDWVRNNPKIRWELADFGAGTGCLGISVALGIRKIFPTAEIHVHFVESSSDALFYLNKNIATHLENQWGITTEVLPMDWSRWSPRPLDLFLSNPPYLSQMEYEQVEQGVSEFEPKSALVPTSGSSGYEAYRELLQIASQSLKSATPTFLGFELGTFQAEWILTETKKYLPSFESRIEKDMAGKKRFLVSQSS